MGVRLILLLCLWHCCPMKWGHLVTWTMFDPTSVDMLPAFKSWNTNGVLVMGQPLINRSPHCFRMAACECMMWKVYLKSVYMFAFLLAARVRALVSAISSAFWKEVPEGMGWESIISDNFIYSYLFSLPMS